ncbi:hypothetical protein RFI_10255 [Reticulomyxa filosa]|uniref:Beta-lactamase-related domain-containing protein n=1 Tax=Reticulomyxa filosa TaxID=46433 RepID=X6NMI0_RETFI|nr:hypothetical protein RFI_10255 [Reticulomyxa filosa]|eukprot:ETO26879.1 hypothetical protein RFI_10255 [Reticulomyxa filosa]
MAHTQGDTHGRLILHRAKQYVRVTRRKKPKYYVRHADMHPLANAPFVDNSYKFAGGGIVSTASDIAGLAHHCILGDFFKPHIKRLMLEETTYTQDIPDPQNPGFYLFIFLKKKRIYISEEKKTGYGKIGWRVVYDHKKRLKLAGHSGGACGGTSHVVVIPDEELVVCILINMRANPQICYEIAQLFSEKEILRWVPFRNKQN